MTPVGLRRLPLVVQDSGKGLPLAAHGPATTLNEELVAPARPEAAAFRVHPVHRPVTRRSLNVATPLTAFTVVVPVRPQATTHTSSESDTEEENQATAPPCAALAA